jgi:hypothetical protein
MANDTDIRKILMAFSVTFPDRKLTQQGIDIYCDLLRDLDIEFLITASKELMTKNKFFPAISEIREAVKELACRASGIPSAEEAWGEVQNQIGSVGSYGSPVFSSELVRKAVDACGGWYHLCVEANFEVVRAQLMKIYSAYTTRARDDAFMLPSTKEYIGNNSSVKLIGGLTNKFKQKSEI